MNATLLMNPPLWFADESITRERCSNVNALLDEMGEECRTPCAIHCEPSYDLLGSGIRLAVEFEDCDPSSAQDAIECLQEALMLEFDTRFE